MLPAGVGRYACRYGPLLSGKHGRPGLSASTAQRASGRIERVDDARLHHMNGNLLPFPAGRCGTGPSMRQLLYAALLAGLHSAKHSIRSATHRAAA
jgi:hypothetical protein